jgi:hypothetical protein
LLIVNGELSIVNEPFDDPIPEVGDKTASRGRGLSISTTVNAIGTTSTMTTMCVQFVPENRQS